MTGPDRAACLHLRNLLQHRRHVGSHGVLDNLVLDGLSHLQMRALVLVLGKIGTSHLEDEHFPLISSHPGVRTIANMLTTGGMWVLDDIELG